MWQITIGHLGHFFLGQIWTQGTLRHILGPILVIFEICHFLAIPGPFEYFSKYQGVKEFHMLARVGCCNIMVFSPFKVKVTYYHPLNLWLLGATSGNQGQTVMCLQCSETIKICLKLQIPYYHPLNLWLLGATNGNQGQTVMHL